MKSSFFEKLLERVEHLEPGEVQNYLRKLSVERDFLETIFNTLQEGVVVLDRDGIIEYFNRSAGRLLSLPEDKAPGSPIGRYLKGVDWKTLLQEGAAATRTLEIHYPEVRWLQFYLVPLEKGRKGGGSVAVIFHDITQERDATREAIESERLGAITLLAAGVAHELGNPLNSLNIHLQLMEREIRRAPRDVAEKLEDYVRVARTEIDRLDSIINQFLRAIRPAVPDLVPGKIEDLLDETLELLGRELKERDVLVEREYAQDIPQVSVDREQMKQAFYNIIRNAMQAMSGSGILRIAVERDDLAVLVRFTDNGSGISEQDMPHILQPYFTTKTEGTGLGLMIVHRIVREHGGELFLESVKGTGTTVTIRLPLLDKRVHLLDAPREGRP
jgi:PAS domain S-box-containing protein